MTETIPVNPAILRWARETSGLSVQAVARKLNQKKVTAETVTSWEMGDGSPSYVQLERLAYQIFKRPMALFFFPEPPVEQTPKQAFRTLPEQEIKRIPSRVRYLIRQAKSMQLNLDELYDGINPAQKQIIHDVRFTPDIPTPVLVESVRRYLGVELAYQKAWKSEEEAFAAWRNAIEDSGIFVFKEAFKDDAFSGFCLFDERFPLIYVNNSKPMTRQIFTLFHELAHLLSGTGGVDTPLEDYIDFLQGEDKRVEVLCNGFAGSFLVPDADFDETAGRLSVDDSTIEKLAGWYCVSREVILRKFYDRNVVDQRFYEAKVKQWAAEGKGKTGKGGDYYRTKGVYLGERYLSVVFSRLYQNRISLAQLAEYLGVKVKNVPGMEALVFRKGLPV
jgi:Zn-dependent peptidase ImmA (M78 family)